MGIGELLHLATAKIRCQRRQYRSLMSKNRREKVHHSGISAYCSLGHTAQSQGTLDNWEQGPLPRLLVGVLAKELVVSFLQKYHCDDFATASFSLTSDSYFMFRLLSQGAFIPGAFVPLSRALVAMWVRFVAFDFSESHQSG